MNLDLQFEMLLSKVNQRYLVCYHCSDSSVARSMENDVQNRHNCMKIGRLLYRKSRIACWVDTPLEGQLVSAVVVVVAFDDYW